jgi:hypothetical protein
VSWVRRGVVAAVAGAMVAAEVAAAQAVSGRVVRPGPDHPRPVAGAWVVLHRIAEDSAGPLDSARTDARGSYTFRYRRTPEDSALYLVSSVYAGVAYFTPPLRGANVRGEAAEIVVFDTTSAPLPLRVQGRHLVVAARSQRTARHEVLEVYELSNDTTLTAVAGGGRAVWSAVVPEGATRFRLGQGDVSEGGLVFRNGRAELFAPVAPGLKQISFRYELPSDAFPLSVPVTEPVGVLEVVAEDPGARVTGAGLTETRAMNAEGRTFKRFLAQDAPRNAVVRIQLSTRDAAARGVAVALLAGFFAAAAGGALAVAVRRWRRASSSALAPARPDSEARALLRAIADLDVRFAGAERDAAPDRAAYEAQRRALKEQLRAALARRPGSA